MALLTVSGVPSRPEELHLFLAANVCLSSGLYFIGEGPKMWRSGLFSFFSYPYYFNACLMSTPLKTGAGAIDYKCRRDQRLNVVSEVDCI
jgi:hypothetical protein